MAKKIMSVALCLVFAFGAIAPASASNGKPASSWQWWDRITNTLIVLVGGPGTKEVHHGPAEDYDGSATDPAAPTQAYTRKQSLLNDIKTYDAQGLDELAAKARAELDALPHELLGVPLQ